MKKQKRQSALLAFLDVDLSKYDSAETSSDESFRIENHTEDSDIESSNGSDSESEDSDEKSSDDEPELKESKTNDVSHLNSACVSSATQISQTEELLKHTKSHSIATAKLMSTLVCCACLGDRSDDTNEIVECDGCKITVHEGCYGVSESVSVSSTISSCSTEPWFCEACKANVKDPDCELCPNRGGIFKETDCGKWVHLVCALYVPGVAFGEVDQLTMVTLFEMQYNKWGAKPCSLCEDERFARTGVCIGCDAGMCKTYFHVTCAQKAGLLSEAHHEEVDQADPFYAHCKVHSDKTLIKHRKRNYNALLMQMRRHAAEVELLKNEKPTLEQERIERKLKKHRIKHTSNKLNRIEPWVPTQKMPRLINTSASACKKLMKKAELMGIDAAALEFQEAQIASLTDIRKKWHIPPAFTTEFVGYHLDRSLRITEMRTNLETQVEVNKSLVSQRQMLETKYDDACKINAEVQQRRKDLITEIEQLHTSIKKLCPSKQLPIAESIGRPLVMPAAVKMVAPPVPMLSSTPPPQLITSRTISVPTAAALKMGVGFPLNNLQKDDTGRILSTQCISNDELKNECGICKKCTDQHLLAKCDTCRLYYHLGCLNPPLTRHPKRSKLYAWQCSECDKSDDSAPENVIIPKGPRRSRVRYSKDGPIIPDPLRDSFGSEKSVALSKKSDESHHRTMNGSEMETDVEQKLLEPLTEPLEPLPVTEACATEPVSSISSPITDNSISPEATSSVKKRGRKPKPKVPKIALDLSAPIDLTSPPTKPPAPSKELVSENQLKDLNSFTEQQLFVAKVETNTPPKGIDVKKNSIVDPKMIKKGRPRKEKPSLTQISDKLQKKQEIEQQKAVEPKPDVTLIDLSRKTEGSLEHFRTFADIPNSIPYPAPAVELPKVVDEIEMLPVYPVTKQELIPMNGIVVNGEGTTSSSSGHKHKKHKSHKRRHSNSPSSGDRQTSKVKKHKQKRKKDKLPDQDEAVPANPLETARSPEQPRIKMKFCAKFVQAGDDKKIMWSLPNTGEDREVNPFQNSSFPGVFSNPNPDPFQPMMKTPMGNGHGKAVVAKKRKKPSDRANAKKARLLFNISSNKGISSPVIAPSHFTVSATSTPEAAAAPEAPMHKSLPLPSQICDVCHAPGSNQNLVKCDECQKNYHFTCLMPPLKKTPKKRGYSWHCADCDPTDRENN